ncbi:MAG: glycosyltransferase [Mesorhizobium sp.]
MSIAQALDYHALPYRANETGQHRPDGANDDEKISAELAEWWDMLADLGLSSTQASVIDRRARRLGSSIIEEVLADSLVDETKFYVALAAELGLQRVDRIDPRDLRLTADEALERLRGGFHIQPIQCLAKDGLISYVISPAPKDMLAFRIHARAHPSAWRNVALVPRAAMRPALMAIAQPLLISTGRDQLFLQRPDLSARIVSHGWQGAMFATLAIAIPLGWLLVPKGTNLTLHLIATLFFLGCVTLRMMASFGDMPRPPPKPPPDIKDTPFYTILIAVYDEADVVPELLVSLDRIKWPRSRLEIKLLCESDDHKTIEAIAAQNRRPYVEIIKIPPGMPRTKPNALSYALPTARGDFIVLYDAEDRPHPSQLIEAWRRFHASNERLACLQAPLNVSGPPGLIPRMFAFEYAGLFRRLLPYLGRTGGFLPLGGTSNHFRRDALEAVGGWDPYNVTEDADLGARLARNGYFSDVIGCGTDEDAPDSIPVWVRQRTRWLKGWAQTWLVHMREPRRLLAEVGFRSFLVIQIVFLGVIVSCLSHPFVLFWAAWLLGRLVMVATLSPLEMLLLALDLFNLAFGYAAFILIGAAAHAHRPANLRKIIAFTPVYWLLMSFAAWRAVMQLYFEPHRWEKTPHKPHRKPAQAAVKSIESVHPTQ